MYFFFIAPCYGAKRPSYNKDEMEFNMQKVFVQKVVLDRLLKTFCALLGLFSQGKRKTNLLCRLPAELWAASSNTSKNDEFQFEESSLHRIRK